MCARGRSGSAQPEAALVLGHLEVDLAPAGRALAELEPRGLDGGDARLVVAKRLELDDGLVTVGGMELELAGGRGGPA